MDIDRVLSNLANAGVAIEYEMANEEAIEAINYLRQKLASLQPTSADDAKDAARWRYFRETASEEMCYALCGNSNPENDELDAVIDQAIASNRSKE